ncbi:MAG: DUF1631 family protein [Pseudomonadota bacterium]
MTESPKQVVELAVASKDKRISVIRRVKLAYEQRLTYLMEGLQANVEDALFEEMMDMEEQDALRSHFNIMRAMRLESSQVLSEIKLLINLSWTNIANAKDKSPVPAVSPRLDLTIRRMCDKHNGNYRMVLSEIQSRLSWLSRTPITYHPMLPSVLCMSFWYATEKTRLTEQERELLVVLFNRFVLDRIGQLLSVTNRILIEEGIRVSDA